MILVNTSEITGREITEMLGLVREIVSGPAISAMILWQVSGILLAVKSRNIQR